MNKFKTNFLNHIVDFFIKKTLIWKENVSFPKNNIKHFKTIWYIFAFYLIWILLFLPQILRKIFYKCLKYYFILMWFQMFRRKMNSFKKQVVLIIRTNIINLPEWSDVTKKFFRLHYLSLRKVGYRKYRKKRYTDALNDKERQREEKTRKRSERERNS